MNIKCLEFHTKKQQQKITKKEKEKKKNALGFCFGRFFFHLMKNIFQVKD